MHTWGLLVQYFVWCILYTSQHHRFGGISGRPIGFYYHQTHTPTQSSFWFWTLDSLFSFSDFEDDDKEGDNFNEQDCFVSMQFLKELKLEF